MRTKILCRIKRVKADLILIFSTNKNCETVAYRSFQFLEFELRGVRKLTRGEHVFFSGSVALGNIASRFLIKSEQIHII